MGRLLFEQGDYCVGATALGYTVFVDLDLELDSYATFAEAKARCIELAKGN